MNAKNFLISREDNFVHFLGDGNLQVFLEFFDRDKKFLSQSSKAISHGFSGAEQQLLSAIDFINKDTAAKHHLVFCFSLNHWFDQGNKKKFMTSDSVDSLYERLTDLLVLLKDISVCSIHFLNLRTQDSSFNYQNKIFGPSEVFQEAVSQLIRDRDCIYYSSPELSISGEKYVADNGIKVTEFKLFGNPCESWFVHNVLSNIERSIKPKNIKKCLVLDLDNTLWGGVLGDDGVSNLEFNGPSYIAIRNLINLCNISGIFTAICSKNDAELVSETFKSNSVPFSESDFDVVIANWNSKASNIKHIANSLNISPESFIFLDDNPLEIADVNSAFPGILSILINHEDPVGVMGMVNLTWAFLKPETISAADNSRKMSVVVNRQIEDMLLQKKTQLEILNALKSEVILSNNHENLERIYQLFNKTNQFNNTGLSVDYEILKSYDSGDNNFLHAFELKDKYLNYGVIAAITGSFNVEKRVVIVENFCLSCRAFNRGVESHIFKYLQDKMNSNFFIIKSKNTGKNRRFFELMDELSLENITIDIVDVL